VVSERVTGIELALSAWEADRIVLPEGLIWRFGCPFLTVTDPWLPGLMARLMGLVILRAKGRNRRKP
jgi:hypothetical protein